MSENPHRFFSDAGVVPIADRQSVHAMPVIAGTMELVKRYRTIYQRSRTRIALAQEVYPSAVTETSSV